MTIRATLRETLSRFPMADGMFRRFLWSRVHFPETELRFLDSLPTGSIDIAIDVGAALGSYTWVFNRKAKTVYAFEPGQLHSHFLEKSIAGSRVRLIKAAVGSTKGTVAMYTPGDDTNARHSATLSTGNPVVQTAGTEVRQVEQIVLDDFFVGKLDQGRSIDVLKVDVEGYELEVFRGAQRLIERHHPLVICEIEERHNVEYLKTFQLLRDAGYRCYYNKEQGFVPFDGDALAPLQSAEALERRLGGKSSPGAELYINNFVFQHPKSRVKVAA